MHKHEILQSYRELLPELQKAAAALHADLVRLLDEKGIEVHNVSYRIKSEASVRGKIARPDRIYGSVHELTDLIGLRVVTYFEDTIEAVAQLVEEHFPINREHSVDKRQQLDPSTFGYRSLHYVCFPSEKSRDVSFEIQIRTILQHAWAEIEHDLGYKFPEAVPMPIKRRFSRLAGLLEIADAEFVELRKTMETYESEVKTRIRDGQGLDLPLLKSIVESPAVRGQDSELAQYLQKPLSDSIFFPDYLIRLLHAAGLSRAQDIISVMADVDDRLVPFMETYFLFTSETWGFSGSDFDTVQQGYSLFLQAHWQALMRAKREGRDLESLTAFFRSLDYPDNEAEARRIASLFLTHFKGWT